MTNTKNKASKLKSVYLTKYEYSMLVGRRAEQITMNYPIRIDYEPGESEISIAEKEIKAGVAPVVLVRPTPGGGEERYFCTQFKTNHL